MNLSEKTFYKKELLRKLLKNHWLTFLNTYYPENIEPEEWESSFEIENTFDDLYYQFIQQLPYIQRELYLGGE